MIHFKETARVYIYDDTRTKDDVVMNRWSEYLGDG